MNDKENQEIDYNKISDDFKEYATKAITKIILGYEPILKLLGDIKDKKVLDYGCGEGFFSRMLANRSANVIGVDVSSSLIDAAKKQDTINVDYINITDQKLTGIPDKYFDIAIVNFVFCTIPSEKTIQNIIQEIYRVLNLGGILIISNPNWDKSNGRDFVSYTLTHQPNLSLGTQVHPVLKSSQNIHLTDYYWPQVYLVDLFTRQGFTVDQTLEPLASGGVHLWKDEIMSPPLYIIKATK